MLQITLGHRFATPALLVEALTHVSAVNPSGEGQSHNERLEFLGDRVLGLIVAELLLERFPRAREGALAPRLNELVRRETLAALAEEIGLAGVVRLPKGETLEGSRARAAVLADACEAVIAALYLDGGLKVARRFVVGAIGPRLDALKTVPRDAKTALQEWAQGQGLSTPVYAVLGREGPDHAPRFTIAVSLDGYAAAQGEGVSKRLAEQAAAQAFMTREGLAP